MPPRCVVCLCVRDVERFTRSVFSNILKLRDFFDIISVTYFLDPSNDKTLDVITEIKSECSNDEGLPLVELIENTSELHHSRTMRIAHGRNSLFRFVEENYASTDYVIMIDGDNISSGHMDPSVIGKYLSMSVWDALSFNREDYYDIWALCYEPYIHNMWSFHEREHSLEVLKLMKDDISNRLSKLGDGELLECYSAFNGFAIYRFEKFHGCVYDGQRQTFFPRGRIDEYASFLEDEHGLGEISVDFGKSSNCEHVAFHMQAIRENNARIRISRDILFR